MSNSFVLPSLDHMRNVDITQFSYFQSTCAANLREHLRIYRMIINFFDTQDIMDDFITTYSNYMAYKCVIRRVNGNNDGVDEIRFFLPADSLLTAIFGFMNNNILYTRRSTNINTFIQLCTAFVEYNLPSNGIFTETWNPITMPVFESLGSQSDTIAICIAVNTAPDHLSRNGELERIFEQYAQDRIDRTFATNKQHKAVISKEHFEITEENKDDANECKLCCANESIYVCESCKYPLCKDCIKHILKSTGLCPCCRATPLTVQIVHRENHELIDDLNFDYEPPTGPKTNFAPEEINEELDAEIHGRLNVPVTGSNSELTGSFNDDLSQREMEYLRSIGETLSRINRFNLSSREIFRQRRIDMTDDEIMDAIEDEE